MSRPPQALPLPPAPAATSSPVLPLIVQDQAAPPVAPASAAPSAPASRQRQSSPRDGMTRPTHMLAQAYIRAPDSGEIRRALPKLAPSERATQICNIEAGQQIEAARPGVFVDTVHASALADIIATGLTITAPGAAYRSRRKWYAVSFICTVDPAYTGVTEFAFRIGEPIPPDQWDAHDLNAEDEAE